MPVPNIDYDNQAVNMLPFRERRTKWMVFAKGLVYAAKWLYGVFKAYMSGDYSPKWDSTITYSTGNKVQYNFRVYESLTDGNLNNVPDQSATNWLLRNNDFIGAIERAKYNGRYLELTYALNRYFSTTFRQPPYPSPYDFGVGGTFSDIYITNVAPAYASFVSFNIETPSSASYNNSSTTFASFNTEIYTAATSYEFAIWIPLAVFNALGASDPIRESVVRGFADKLVVSGTHYIINTY